MKMHQVMIDLETMGNTSSAAIVAIGACRFGIDDGRIHSDTFYCNVDLQSSIDAGLTIDAGTVMWWLKQSDKARSAIGGESVPLVQALALFAKWFGDDSLPLWGNGAGFDNVILSHAYKQCRIEQPWKFWHDRCYRTKKSEYHDIKLSRYGEHHNALDDAISQAIHLIAIYQHQMRQPI